MCWIVDLENSFKHVFKNVSYGFTEAQSDPSFACFSQLENLYVGQQQKPVEKNIP